MVSTLLEILVTAHKHGLQDLLHVPVSTLLEILVTLRPGPVAQTTLDLVSTLLETLGYTATTSSWGTTAG